MQIVYEAVQKPRYRPTSHQWRRTPLSRFCKLWSQLTLCDGVLCRQYTPQPLGTGVTVPILPKSLQRQALQQCHDSPVAGHQGYNKTLECPADYQSWLQSMYCHFGQKWVRLHRGPMWSVVTYQNPDSVANNQHTWRYVQMHSHAKFIFVLHPVPRHWLTSLQFQTGQSGMILQPARQL